MRQTFYESIAVLQANLDTWLVHDNSGRPHHGYRDGGRLIYRCLLLRKWLCFGRGDGLFNDFFGHLK